MSLYTFPKSEAKTWETQSAMWSPGLWAKKTVTKLRHSESTIVTMIKPHSLLSPSFYPPSTFPLLVRLILTKQVCDHCTDPRWVYLCPSSGPAKRRYRPLWPKYSLSAVTSARLPWLAIGSTQWHRGPRPGTSATRRKRFLPFFFLPPPLLNRFKYPRGASSLHSFDIKFVETNINLWYQVPMTINIAVSARVWDTWHVTVNVCHLEARGRPLCPRCVILAGVCW